MRAPSAKLVVMEPSLESVLFHKGVDRMVVSRFCCRSCRRTPLAGERVFVLDSGHAVCALCHAGLSEAGREGAEPHLVHAAERPLAVRTLAA